VLGEPDCKNNTGTQPVGWASFIGFRELKRGAPGGSHGGESQLTGTNRFSFSNQLMTTTILGVAANWRSLATFLPTRT
jgi:hypothetical protein